MLDERWIRSLHVESMRRADLHAERDPHVLFQASTIGALLDGAFDGDLSFAELAEHGDLGLGTLNRLDGEMIALDGEFFRADVDGAVSPIAADGEDAVRGGDAGSSPRSTSGSRSSCRTRSCWRGSTPWSRPAPPPARSASTAASSWSAPARSRPRARPTGRWPRSSPTSTSSSSRTSPGRCSASASPPTPRGSRSPATTCTSSATTALAAATCSTRAPRRPASCGSIPPTTSTSSCRPPIELADPDLAAATHEAIVRAEGG